MNVILLPIKKEFSERILNGIKKIEYRKKLPSRNIDRILIYESRGCGMIVGECEVTDTVYCDKRELWETTFTIGGISQEQYDAYFKDVINGVGFVIGEIYRYESPKPLSVFGIKRAPQNYIWIYHD